ncbi:MAG: glycosyltransferase [Bacteroidales bacterium]
MNILILTHSYPDLNNRWRGIFIQEQAKVLSLSHNVFLVYFKVDYSHLAPFSGYKFTIRKNQKITEYEVTTGRSFPVINQLKYLRNTYSFIKKEILANHRIDIIHSHFAYPAGFLGTIIQKLQKIPNIITEHSWIRKHFRSWIHKQCAIYGLRNSEAVVAVSNILREDLKSYCNREVIIIPNVVDLDKFTLSRKLRGETFNIGILGGMNNFRKGFDILIESLALLKDLDIRAHIGGDGIHRGKFIQLAREKGVYDKCIFYGEILAEDIQQFYSRLDTFVLASRDETFGVVVIEAMASGLPVIATDCGGPKEILTRETGLLVARENPPELAKAIRYMSANLESYDKEFIRNYVFEKYGTRTFTESVSRLYQNVVKKSDPSF